MVMVLQHVSSNSNKRTEEKKDSCADQVTGTRYKQDTSKTQLYGDTAT